MSRWQDKPLPDIDWRQIPNAALREQLHPQCLSHSGLSQTRYCIPVNSEPKFARTSVSDGTSSVSGTQYIKSPRPGLGVPQRKPLVAWRDIGIFAVNIGALITAVVIVFVKRVAIQVNQTNQLILVGLMLSIMSFSTQKQVSRCLLLLEARHGRSTLQNLVAFIEDDCLAFGAGGTTRMALVLLFTLPLVLTVLYKKLLLGGFTQTTIDSIDGVFGLTAPPRLANVGGLGGALIVSEYLPFWQAPALNTAYGFNMFVADNDTTAMLDAPFGSTLATIQDSLDDGESVLLAADVNATVAHSEKIEAEDRADLQRYWEPMYKTWLGTFDLYDEYASQIFVGGGPNYSNTNNTITYVSVWELGRETFAQTADRIILTRRTCHGIWNITQSTVSLVDAQILQSADEAQHDDQLLIQANLLNFTIYDTLFRDYNWRASPRPNDINTRVPLVAAMGWARLATKDGSTGNTEDSGPYSGLQSDPAVASLPHYNAMARSKYLKSAETIRMVKQTPTLKRTPYLLVVLVIYPLLSLVAVVVRTSLYTTPIDQDFGVISLLSAMDWTSLQRLRGAALSGRVTRPVRVRFDVGDDSDIGGTHGRVRIALDAGGESGRLKRGITYG